MGGGRGLCRKPRTGDDWWSLSHEVPHQELLGLPGPVDSWCERDLESQASVERARKPDLTILEAGTGSGDPLQKQSPVPTGPTEASVCVCP